MKNMYALFDRKALAYNTPVFFNNNAEALRSLTTGAKKDPTISQWPNDFELFYIGKYDENTGKVIPESPTALATAADCLRTVDQETELLESL